MNKKPTRDQLLNLSAQHEYELSTELRGAVIMALDYGEKFCGLAVAPDGITVLPAAVVDTSKLESALESMVSDYTPQTLVIGLPVSANGAENHICAQIRTLAAKLENQLVPLAIELVNERHSSQAVIGDKNDRIDDLAAMQILEFYLAQNKS